ncbi:hypothetical protein [Pseudarthrobacter scleromae]|uniref:hypothetical protein n=1 Tax=Pseudarthrobacter scleromae TaxID=158897 RepID=UPI003D035800
MSSPMLRGAKVRSPYPLSMSAPSECRPQRQEVDVTAVVHDGVNLEMPLWIP